MMHRRLPKTPPKKLESVRRSRVKRRADPKLVAATKRYNQNYAKKNADRIRTNNREYQKKFAVEIRLARKGLAEHHAAVIRKHKGRCDICGGRGDGRWRQLNIDHCHKKKVFRGMLCSNCNRGLGYFKDSPTLLKKAIAYLKRRSP